MPDYERNDAGEVLPPETSENTGDLDANRRAREQVRTDGSGVKGYVPPEGPQNLHTADYRWMGAQGAHRIGSVTVYSPEGVILTADTTAQREIERHGLHEIEQSVADEALAALRDDDPDLANDLVAEYRSDSEDVATTAEDRREIPDDEDLNDAEYSDLQGYAKDHGIAANQSADELREQLAAERDGTAAGEAGGESYDEPPEDGQLDSEGGTRGEADAETLDSEGGTRAEADEETLDSEGDGGDGEPADEPSDGNDEGGDGDPVDSE